MAQQTKIVLKGYFLTGYKPNQDQYFDLIDTLATQYELDNLELIVQNLIDHGVGATGPAGATGSSGISYGFEYNALYNQSPHFVNNSLVTDGQYLDDDGFFYLSSRDLGNNDLEDNRTIFTTLKNQMMTSSPSGEAYFTVKLSDPLNPINFQSYKLKVNDFNVIHGATGGAILNNISYIGGGLVSNPNKVIITFNMPAGDSGSGSGTFSIPSLQQTLEVGNTASLGIYLYGNNGYYLNLNDTGSSAGFINDGGQTRIYNYNNDTGGQTSLFFTNDTSSNNDQHFQNKSGIIALKSDIYPNLPVPKVRLLNGGNGVKIQSVKINEGIPDTDLYLQKPPIVIAQDFTQDELDNWEIYVEMVYYRRGSHKGSKLKGYKSSDYVAPPSWIDDGSGTFYNPSPWSLGGKFWQRDAPHTTNNGATPINVARPNHYRVKNLNQNIPVYEYLNGRFCWYDVAYRDIYGANVEFNMPVPFMRRRAGGSNRPTVRYAYSPVHTPLYVAFRYVIWDPNANSGRGNIISGPLSEIVCVTTKYFPFNFDYAQSEVIGAPVTRLTDKFRLDPDKLKCWFVSRLP